MVRYYEAVIFPVVFVLVLGSLVLIFMRKSSAAARQFVAAATLCCCIAVSLVPFLPVKFRPSMPNDFRPIITFHPNPYQTTYVDVMALPSTLRPSQLQLDWLQIVGLVLGFITFGLILRIGASWLLGIRLRNRSSKASDYISAISRRQIRVVEGLSSPVAIGGLRPIILLPAEAESWPEDQLRAILIHEEAHLDHGDPTWQTLAELACALHWFNPLIWILRNALRSSSERAADDCVIESGIRPSSYATDLATFATRIGKTRPPIGWSTFIRKETLKGRIQAILNQNTQRNPMKKTSKIASIVGLACVAYVTSAYVKQGDANPKSYDPEIRAGKTVAARASNNYVGQLSDHRPVEILQISRQMPNGSIVSWKPDGTVLSKSDVIAHRFHPLKTLDTHTRYLVFRFPLLKGKSDIPNAGCGSGGSTAERPSEMVFAGGGNIRVQDGYQYVVSFIGLPKEDSETFAVGVGISDSTWSTEWKIDSSNKLIREVEIQDVDRPMKDDTGFEKWWDEHKGRVTKVQFVLPMTEPFHREERIVPVLKSGAKHLEKNELGNFGGYIQKPPYNPIEGFRFRYYFGYKKDEIQELVFQTRESHGCEVYDLAANPKKGP